MLPVGLCSLAGKLTSVLKGTVIHMENYSTGDDGDDYSALDMTALLDNLEVIWSFSNLKQLSSLSSSCLSANYDQFRQRILALPGSQDPESATTSFWESKTCRALMPLAGGKLMAGEGKYKWIYFKVIFFD
jgi:hypothetical protein